VLDAAVASILEKGYYKTSSNEIARRAGVTWGTIQHQFGTREGLLLALLSDRWTALDQRLSDAEVVGDTLEDRLGSVLEVLAGHFEEPEHLVQLQILLDLSQDPGTSAETRDAVKGHGRELGRVCQPLFEDALGEAAVPDLIRYAFVTFRWYLTGTLIASRLADAGDDVVPRRLLVEGVAAAIRAESARRGLGGL
jgi:AcrR family transcriptional regulator